MSYETFNKVKHFVCIILISALIAFISFGVITGSYTRVELLQTTIQRSGTVEGIKIRKEEPRKAILTINDSGGQNPRKESTDQKQVKLVLKGFATGAIQQEYANHAYKIGGENLLYLILCENGGLDLDLQSRVQQSYGREKSYGLCQLGLPRKGVDTKRFLTDYKYQLDTCWEYRKTGTPFYGPTRKLRNGELCYIWASKQVLFYK